MIPACLRESRSVKEAVQRCHIETQPRMPEENRTFHVSDPAQLDQARDQLNGSLLGDIARRTKPLLKIDRTGSFDVTRFRDYTGRRLRSDELVKVEVEDLAWNAWALSGIVTQLGQTEQSSHIVEPPLTEIIAPQPILHRGNNRPIELTHYNPINPDLYWMIGAGVAILGLTAFYGFFNPFRLVAKQLMKDGQPWTSKGAIPFGTNWKISSLFTLSRGEARLLLRGEENFIKVERSFWGRTRLIVTAPDHLPLRKALNTRNFALARRRCFCAAGQARKKIKILDEVFGKSLEVVDDISPSLADRLQVVEFQATDRGLLDVTGATRLAPRPGGAWMIELGPEGVKELTQRTRNEGRRRALEEVTRRSPRPVAVTADREGTVRYALPKMVAPAATEETVVTGPARFVYVCRYPGDPNPIVLGDADQHDSQIVAEILTASLHRARPALTQPAPEPRAVLRARRDYLYLREIAALLGDPSAAAALIEQFADILPRIV